MAVVMFFISNGIAILNIKGDSMYPTYEDGNVLVLRRKTSIDNGDIIVFDSPDSWGSEGRKFIKRVIASEGDSISISNSSIMVNGVEIDNEYENSCEVLNNNSEITINLSKGELFVRGDNFNFSNDSAEQFCQGNEEFIVSESGNIISGKELFLLERGLFN